MASGVDTVRMEQLGLPLGDIAAGMGQMLGRINFRAGRDGRDIEFVLCGDMSNPLSGRPSYACIDFNQMRPHGGDPGAIVDSIVSNDPYYPKPSSPHWGRFVAAYKAEAAEGGQESRRGPWWLSWRRGAGASANTQQQAKLCRKNLVLPLRQFLHCVPMVPLHSLVRSSAAAVCACVPLFCAGAPPSGARPITPAAACPPPPARRCAPGEASNDRLARRCPPGGLLGSGVSVPPVAPSRDRGVSRLCVARGSNEPFKIREQQIART